MSMLTKNSVRFDLDIVLLSSPYSVVPEEIQPVGF